MTPTRRLAAIMAADIAGFSAAMERDEEGTFAQVQELRRKIIEPKIAEHQGRLIKTTGDGFLAEFASPLAAMRSALAIQAQAHSGALRLRIGLNLGDVIIEENGDVYGDGVNVAARLEGLAEPGGVWVSDKIFREVEGKIGVTFEDRGEHQVKNLTRPVHVFAARKEADRSADGVAQVAVRNGNTLTLPDKPSIAVLPFTNMSGDAEQEYFADGIVEDIITALSRFKSLFVIARNSSFTYKGKAVDVKRVGRELGVRYVLEGSVRKAGQRIRITGQLIDAANGAHLWAERFDSALEDVFDLQDQVTARVVGVIAPTIEQSEIERAKRKPTESLDSYDLFLRGMALAYRYSTMANAQQCFRRAVEREPEFAAAHAMFSYVWLMRLGSSGSLSDDERAEALKFAEQAARLGGDDASVLARAAHVFAYIGHDYTRAASMADRAVNLNPNLAVAWYSRGWVSVMRAEPEHALQSFERMERLSPLDPLRIGALFGEAFAYWFQARYNEGHRVAIEAVNIGASAHSLVSLIVNATSLGRTAESREAAVRLLKVHPNFRVSDVHHTFPIHQIEWRNRIQAALREVGVPE